MLKTAFSTLSCPDWDWGDLLRYGPEYGYDGVEIRLLKRETDLLKLPVFQASQLAARRRELVEAGFRVCGLASSVRFDYPEAEERMRQHETGCRYVDLAAELDAGFVRVFGDVLPDPEDPRTRETTLKNIAEGLNRLGEYAAQAGRQIIIETHGDFSSSHLMQEMLQHVENGAVGVLWDTHHPWRFCDEELSGTVERLKSWIRHTHWKDSVSAPRRAPDEASDAAAQAHQLMSGHKHADYVLFGAGEFPIAGCLRSLAGIGYDGWYSLEWEKMWHPELDGPEIALPPFPGKIQECSRLCGL